MSISEQRFEVPIIETVRVINVNVERWSVDAVSEIGGRRYEDIQVMSPYFHFYAGEGVYAMPEVGALAWLCRSSQGRFAAPFILGFQAPFDVADESYRCGRPALNPGDIMLRGRDDNFVILRRGGVIQIGASALAQRMFLPIGNFIRDYCENFELNTLGGQLSWLVERTDETTTGDAPTRFRLLAKEKANDPGHVVDLSLGSHGEGVPAMLDLAINESGAKDAKRKIRLQLTREGKTSWELEGDWSLVAKGKVELKATGSGLIRAEQDLALESAQKLSAKGASVDVQATGAMALSAGADARLEANGLMQLAGRQVLLGAGARHPLVYGDELVILLLDLIKGILGAMSTAPGSPIAAPGVAALAGRLQNILSSTSKTS